MAEKVVVEFITWTVFEYKPDQLFCHYNLIETGDMRVEELAMMMNLAREIRILPWGGLEHNLGTIGELVGSKINLAKGAFPNQPSKGVVTNGSKVLRRELLQ